MKKSTLAIGIIALAFSASAAHAQSFTYTANDAVNTQIGDTGGLASGEVKFTHASGEKETGTYECVSMPSPEDSSIFDLHITCQTEMNDGSYSLVFGCNAVEVEGERLSSCVGSMKGKTGAYENKRGNLSQYSKEQGKNIGVGQWFE